MAYLNSNQRNVLEKAVLAARKAAENGAKNALQALAIHHHEPYPGMDQAKRALRNRLRSKGRLLGDRLESNDTQKIANLVNELAYEYWHKMLFARFLEANGLLIHPSGVSVSLQECEELAQSENLGDKWSAASVYASKMLPAIFRPDDPVMMVEFAKEDRINLEAILEGIPNDIFTADDSLGWVYQFWQTEAKKSINKNEEKIDGKRLPAVTQLFTEPYMVHFLIDNSIGAWWVGHNPGVNPPVEFKYLKYLEDGTPAAGKFEEWPARTKEITSLDPCMGSGHFLVAQFDVFVRLRMFEEGLNPEDAAKAVISDNLFGLEIDPRCTQIAAFNLALAAWKFAGKFFALPEVNLACSGTAPNLKIEELLKFFATLDNHRNQAHLIDAIGLLLEQFRYATELGSLINPKLLKHTLFDLRYSDILLFLKQVHLLNEESERKQVGLIAFGITKALEMLSKNYDIVMTNAPFLKRGRQSHFLKNFCELNFSFSKDELGTVFLERCIELSKVNGNVAIIIPQYWLFHKRSYGLRYKLLREISIEFIGILGSNAFETIGGEVVNVGLFILKKSQPIESHLTNYINVSMYNKPNEKALALLRNTSQVINQIKQIKNPESRIILDDFDSTHLLSQYAITAGGLQTFDKPRFIAYLWEISIENEGWVYLQSAPQYTALYTGRESLLFWQNESGELKNYIDLLSDSGYSSGVWRAGVQVWNMKGIIFKLMGQRLEATLYTGQAFENTTGVLIPKEEDKIKSIWTFCSSHEYSREIRKIDKKLAVTNSTLNKVAFDKAYWESFAEEKYPNGLPKPYSDDPTQWLFHGNPKKTNTPLQVAIARFLGYRWPAESDEKMELAEEARELIKDIKKFDSLTDDDGIVCIPSVNGELSASDRIREYLSGVFGSNWQIQTLQELLKKENTKSANLENWLRDGFFEQHNKLFKNRPFIWQIWDGRKDGFSVLVNYHKLTKENLQKLIYTYLGDWIRQCESKVKNGESGAEGMLFAAQQLKQKMELILQGESPYDIFVRWKPLEKQPIGWDPDINDGVRLNIRPFFQADVLRKKPNIKWGIDRGKNPPGTPWGEIRDNDRHLSLSEKLKING